MARNLLSDTLRPVSFGMLSPFAAEPIGWIAACFSAAECTIRKTVHYSGIYSKDEKKEDILLQRRNACLKYHPAAQHINQGLLNAIKYLGVEYIAAEKASDPDNALAHMKLDRTFLSGPESKPVRIIFPITAKSKPIRFLEKSSWAAVWMNGTGKTPMS